jgi:hypothetical protein
MCPMTAADSLPVPGQQRCRISAVRMEGEGSGWKRRRPPGRRHNQESTAGGIPPLFPGFRSPPPVSASLKKTKALQACSSLKGCTQFSWPFLLPCPPFAAGIRQSTFAKRHLLAKGFFSKAGLLTPSPSRRPSHNGHPLQWRHCRKGFHPVSGTKEVTAAGPFPILTGFPFKPCGTLIGVLL